MDLHPTLRHAPTRTSLPLVVNPERTCTVWERVAARARQRGHKVELPGTIDEPMLRLITGGISLRPVHHSGSRYLFVIPRGTASVRLLSRSSRPSDCQPWHDDRRLLGVNVRRAVFQTEAHVETVDLSGLSPSDGWWPTEEAGAASRWTTGDAELALEPGSEDGVLELSLASNAVYVDDGACRAARKSTVRCNQATGTIRLADAS